ncbi:MAG TPA: heavy metal-responsive transcriptional regulator [Vicinamibacterales bacterium]|nr:heavy metal-responsive transcriptional regulator [Vicinamibacterales bacterium]
MKQRAGITAPGSAVLSPRELAASAGVSTDTLRYYERSGVLPPPARTRAGYRRYPASAVRRVALIRRALAIGFSIKELARVFGERDQGGAPCRKVHAIVSDRLARIDAELAALTALKSELTELLSDWDARLTSTPRGQPARLLESLPVDAGPTCTKKAPVT